VNENQPKSHPRRKHASRVIPVALIYPHSSDVGLSNLGYQFVCSSFESHGGFAPERFSVVSRGGPTRSEIVSVLSGDVSKGLGRFPLIVFSIPFENDYLRVVSALAAGGIPCLSEQRGPRHPLLICGGVSPSMNPEPLALFFDAIFIGEMPEETEQKVFLDALARLCLEKDRKGFWDRSRLTELSEVPGVYIPASYDFRFREQGPIVEVIPAAFHYLPVKAAKRIMSDGPLPGAFVEGQDAVFDSTLLVEINRGCGRGCRFCASGWVHRPVRHCSFAQFQRRIDGEDIQGRTVGLIGSDLAGHPHLMEILSSLLSHGARFSLSSIRPEALTPELIKYLADTGQRTVTLAPETASPRMKKIIGKTIPEELFFDRIQLLVSEGIPNIRFYFMVGLPWELDDDVQAILEFVRRAREVFVNASRPRKKIGTMGVQLNPFVPKPWTPFQWVAMQSPEVLEMKLDVVRRELGKTPNVRVRAESVREAVLQAVLSRADRRIAGPILAAITEGIGVSAFLRRMAWHRDFFAFRERGRDEVFPWDVVDHGIDKTVLRRVFEGTVPSGAKFSGG